MALKRNNINNKIITKTCRNFTNVFLNFVLQFCEKKTVGTSESYDEKSRGIEGRRRARKLEVIIGEKFGGIISCQTSFEFPSRHDISNDRSFAIAAPTCFTDIKPRRAWYGGAHNNKARYSPIVL